MGDCRVVVQLLLGLPEEPELLRAEGLGFEGFQGGFKGFGRAGCFRGLG